MNDFSCSVALIPGFMLDETLWDDFIRYLPEQWTVYHSPLGAEKTIREIARQIAAHLPQRFVLIGFSLGGYIARQLAADYPERVQALIIIASSLREDTEKQIQSKKYLLQATTPETFKGLSHRSITKSLSPHNSINEALISQIKNMGKRLGHQALVTQSSLQRKGVPTKTIYCPTLVIASENDTLRSLDEAHELVKEIPNSSLKIFNKSGHMIPLEQPKELAVTIIRWLVMLNTT